MDQCYCLTPVSAARKSSRKSRKCIHFSESETPFSYGLYCKVKGSQDKLVHNASFRSMKLTESIATPPGWHASSSQVTSHPHPPSILSGCPNSSPVRYSFIILARERHCENKVSRPRIQHNDGHGSNCRPLFWSLCLSTHNQLVGRGTGGSELYGRREKRGQEGIPKWLEPGENEIGKSPHQLEQLSMRMINN